MSNYHGMSSDDENNENDKEQQWWSLVCARFPDAKFAVELQGVKEENSKVYYQIAVILSLTVFPAPSLTREWTIAKNFKVFD